jgi:DNA mismatch repair protein MutS
METCDGRHIKPGLLLRSGHLSGLERSDRENVVANLSVQTDLTKVTQKIPDEVELGQFSLMDALGDEAIIDEIRGLELAAMTPLDALNKLNELQNKIRNRW